MAYAMMNIILCSSNPILSKSIYCVLRDAGHMVESVEYPVAAVQKVMIKKYDVVVIDSDPFGLPAEDASRIIKAVAPDLPVLFVGETTEQGADRIGGAPVDLETITKAIQGITT